MSLSLDSAPKAGQQEWLLLPRDFAQGDSFFDDVMHQFDKRQSQIHSETIRSLESHSLQRSTPSVHADSPNRCAHAAASNEVQASEKGVEGPGRPISKAHAQGRRRSSAGDLLRRSSAFLRAKLDQFRGTRSYDGAENDLDQSSPRSVFRDGGSATSLPPPSKIAINTTIFLPQGHGHSMPQLQHHLNTFQPPVIKEYPPKPLKYSPVEPMTDLPSPRTVHHRISLPVLRHVRTQEFRKNRRKSDTEATPAAEKTRKTRKLRDHV
ncbi:uncharacterized protein BYT42DRAFT_546684 [Radiomyces spectabilis]|uniref:uncharacterized protein n=1 Tax=Radiomyces spectabilis TaxID=64574 RepID=UPI002220A3D8|nr:uncharacterized protein BYT42DRAFT_546684 [Radiomyces spectabilis]KAI8375937.1 hypothetical protein BYT42DRAFT_546684 [Radiomyces spectabilis]